MLGLIGKQRELAGVKTTVRNGKNVYSVCLNPWDIVEEVTPSAKYPDGKKVTPAATQDEFALILALAPEVKYIGDLTPQQESEAIASLEKNCAWYKKQKGLTAKESAAAQKENTSSINIKL